MSNRTYAFLRILIVVAFGFVIINSFFFNPTSRTVRNDVVQGVLLGFGLAFVALPIIARIYVTKVNGWTTIFGSGELGKGILFRAACAQIFPGPVNLPQEAMYWTTDMDGVGHTFSGEHDYIMHFPAGQLPPNNAFWSLTMGDADNRFVPNPINRYSVSDRSGLVPNADGSVDIYIQNAAPAGHESNWLPAPSGKFILWLRVYLPGPAILNGSYKVPPVIKGVDGGVGPSAQLITQIGKNRFVNPKKNNVSNSIPEGPTTGTYRVKTRNWSRTLNIEGSHPSGPISSSSGHAETDRSSEVRPTPPKLVKIARC